MIHDSNDFPHRAFYWSCFTATAALIAFAILEAQPNFFEQLLHSVRLVDAIIFGAFGVWSRTGRVSAPLILFLYCIFLIFDQKFIESPYYYAAIGVYVAVMITSALSLYASWQAAKAAEQQTLDE
jgi:hypothetical protein